MFVTEPYVLRNFSWFYQYTDFTNTRLFPYWKWIWHSAECLTFSQTRSAFNPKSLDLCTGRRKSYISPIPFQSSASLVNELERLWIEIGEGSYLAILMNSSKGRHSKMLLLISVQIWLFMSSTVRIVSGSINTIRILIIIPSQDGTVVLSNSNATISVPSHLKSGSWGCRNECLEVRTILLCTIFGWCFASYSTWKEKTSRLG
jgi:hypothetical protein